MKVVLVLAVMVAAVVARPGEAPASGFIPILDFQLTRDDFGQYSLTYTTADGTKVTEQGALVPNKDNTGHVLVKKGSFSYVAPEGKEISQTWTADDKGFKAEGDHLPVAPAVE